MDLHELKNQINSAGFTQKALDEINRILDIAIDRGGILTEEKKLIEDIMDGEIAMDGAVATYLEDTSAIFTAQLDRIEGAIDREIQLQEEISNNGAVAASTSATSE